MSRRWSAELSFRRIDVPLGKQFCADCGRCLRVRGQRQRRILTLQGPCRLVVRVGRCTRANCPGGVHTVASAAELMIAPPYLAIGWDVFAWIGHRRFARHWSVPQICAELGDTHSIHLSEDAIEDYVRRYETMVAARHTDLEQLRQAYADTKSLVLTIDGLQPEKGHETLYVVRELTQRRVWFAEPLLSSTNDEVRRVLARAKQIAESLGIPIAAWMSDKQDAFVRGIAAEFPGVPHRFCENHFLRDLAKPLLEEDSHAKVQMRRKVRGLREIEQAVLRETAKTVEHPVAITESLGPAFPNELEEATPSRDSTSQPTEVDNLPGLEQQAPADLVPDEMASSAPVSPANQLVLDYCATVRGILNDDQGGPLHPPGLRMAEALTEVRQSLARNLEAKKGASQRIN